MNQEPRQGSVSNPPIVLIVEDDDSNREMYSAYLESAGYWVLGARNGAEGLVEARKYRPNVVVTDVSMPGMSGWDLARALREDKQTTQIGIIAVSGRTLDEITDRTSARSVDIVLTKPCLPDELLGQIQKLIARGRVARIRAGEQIAKAERLKERARALFERSNKHQRRRP